MYLYTLKQHAKIFAAVEGVVNRFKKNVSLHVETTWRRSLCNVQSLWIALKKMYLYTLKQHNITRSAPNIVVNRFKKNVSLHVETTIYKNKAFAIVLWIALKKMYLYTLKQLELVKNLGNYVVNRFKKNVSLHVETTWKYFVTCWLCCESL